MSLGLNIFLLGLYICTVPVDTIGTVGTLMFGVGTLYVGGLVRTLIFVVGFNVVLLGLYICTVPVGTVGTVGTLIFGVGTSYVGGLVGTVGIILDVVGSKHISVGTICTVPVGTVGIIGTLLFGVGALLGACWDC